MTPPQSANPGEGGAVLSDDRAYRYRLWRVWDATRPRACYIMLNPSTADENADDATIRVCRGRAIRLGYGGLDVVNLFALRATNPQEIYKHAAPSSHPFAPHRNTETLMALAREAGIVICAWGIHGTKTAAGPAILRALHAENIAAWAIKINADGSPAHPLRISYDKPLEELRP